MKQKGFSLIELGVVLLIIGLLVSAALVPLSSRQRNQRIEQQAENLEPLRDALVAFAIRNGRLPCPDTDGDGLEDNDINFRCNHPTGIQYSTDPANAYDIDEDDQRIVVQGTLPHQTLSIGRTDVYGNPYLYAVSLNYADSDTAITAVSNSDPSSADNQYPDPTPYPRLTTAAATPFDFCRLSNLRATAPRPTFTACTKGGIRILENAGDASPLYNDLPFLVLSAGSNGANTFSTNEAENLDADRTFVLNNYLVDEFDDQMIWMPAASLGLELINAELLP